MSFSEMEDIKFIGDVNVEKPIIDYLLANGYNIKWIPDLDCRMVDEKLLEIANRGKRILITNPHSCIGQTRREYFQRLVKRV